MQIGSEEIHQVKKGLRKSLEELDITQIVLLGENLKKTLKFIEKSASVLENIVAGDIYRLK